MADADQTGPFANLHPDQQNRAFEMTRQKLGMLGRIPWALDEADQKESPEVPKLLYRPGGSQFVDRNMAAAHNAGR